MSDSDHIHLFRHKTAAGKPSCWCGKTEQEVSHARFIRDQAISMREAGFSEATIAREEAALRGGFGATNLIMGLFDNIGSSKL